MNKSLRKAVIAGNWKMNKTPAETTALINEIKPLHLAQIPHKDLKLGHLIFRPDIQIKNRIRTFNCDLLRL